MEGPLAHTRGPLIHPNLDQWVAGSPPSSKPGGAPGVCRPGLDALTGQSTDHRTDFPPRWASSNRVRETAAGLLQGTKGGSLKQVNWATGVSLRLQEGAGLVLQGHFSSTNRGNPCAFHLKRCFKPTCSSPRSWLNSFVTNF